MFRRFVPLFFFFFFFFFFYEICQANTETDIIDWTPFDSLVQDRKPSKTKDLHFLEGKSIKYNSFSLDGFSFQSAFS